MNIKRGLSHADWWQIEPAKIAVIYLLVGLFWILFSDHLVMEIFKDPTVVKRLSIAKGWFFVLASAMLIFFLVRHKLGQARRSEELLGQQHQLGLELSQAATLEETLQLSLAAALKITGLECGGIYLLDESSGGLVLACHQGLSPELLDSADRVNPGDPRLELVLQGLSAYLDHAGLRMIIPGQSEGLRSLAVVPIMHEGQAVACLNLASRSLKQIPLSLRPLVDSLALQLGGYLGRALAEQSLRESRARYSALFDHAPVSVWEEDFSALKAEFERLRALGVADFAEYFHSHPEEVPRMAGLVKILAVNQETLVVFQVDSREELDLNLNRYFNEGSLKVFREELIALAKGESAFHSEIPIVDLRGRSRILQLGLTVCPGHEESLSRVIVSFMDVTERKVAEEALQKSEENYRLLVESANEGIMIAQDGLSKYCNARTLEITCRTAEEFANTPFVEFIHPADRDLVLGRYQRRIAGENVPTGYAFRIIDGQDDVKWVSINAAVVEWEGRPATLNLITDITGIRKAEKERRRWADAFTYCAHGIAIGLPGDNKILTCNPSFARMHGRSVADIAGVPILSLYDPQEHESVKACIAQSDRLGQVTYDSWMVRADGSKFPVQMDVVSVRDDQGAVLYRVATMQDITERKRYEEALRESQSTLTAALESMTDAVSISDAAGNFIHFNQAFATFHKFDSKSECFKNLIEYPEILDVFFANGELAPLDQWAVPRALRGEIGTHAEYGLRRKDTNQRWIGNYNFAPLRDHDGKIFGSVVVGSDITQRKLAEDKLAESEHLLRLAFDKANSGMCLVDLHGRFFKVNDALCEVFGYPAEQLQGKTFSELTHPEDIGTGSRMLDDFLGGSRDSAIFEKRYIHRDGRVVRGQVSTALIRNRDGQPLYFISQIVDVTARHQAEKALRESEESYRRIVEMANEGIWAMDASYRTTFVNSNMSSLLGYEPTEMLGHPVEHFMFPEDLHNHAQKMENRHQGLDDKYERRFRAKDGSPVWTIVSATALHDEQGAFAGSFAMFTDITHDSIQLLDKDLKIITGNEVSAARLGLRLSDMLGHRVLEFFPSEVKERRRKVLEQALVTGVPQRLQDERQGRHYDSNIFPIKDAQGAVTTIAVYARDITEVVNTEIARAELEVELRQVQKMEAMGTLAGGIAHDFNNILSAIVGYAEIAREDAKGGQVDTEDIEQVLKAAERAKLLVKQILTFSRKVEVNRKPLDLNREVRQSSEMLGKTIPKMIEVHTDLAEDLWHINADPNQMEQILLNMGVNASDAMEGKGRLIIKTENRQVEDQVCLTCKQVFSGPHVVLEIADSGHGMDQQTLEHIFEPFFTTKGLGRGTGLGLSTVYGIVTSHDGHITCGSSPGKGTVFTIYFPALEGWGHKKTPEHIEQESMPQGGTERILLVDDEQAILRLGRRQLEQVGYKVHTASSGEEALEVIQQQRGQLDLVIMDLSMPGVGGYQAIKSIMALEPSSKILIASGYAVEGQVSASLGAGAVGFVAKPFRHSQLLAAVRSALNEE